MTYSLCRAFSIDTGQRILLFLSPAQSARNIFPLQSKHTTLNQVLRHTTETNTLRTRTHTL